jgi:hypothetical protein
MRQHIYAKTETTAMPMEMRSKKKYLLSFSLSSYRTTSKASKGGGG